MSVADTVLLFGLVLVLPFTAFVPGFLRLWRRREIEVFLTAQTGAALVTAAALADGRHVLAAPAAAWLVGLTVAYARAGARTRTA